MNCGEKEGLGGTGYQRWEVGKPGDEGEGGEGLEGSNRSLGMGGGLAMVTGFGIEGELWGGRRGRAGLKWGGVWWGR